MNLKSNIVVLILLLVSLYNTVKLAKKTEWTFI